MRIVILEKLHKYTKSILGKKTTTYYKSVQNTSLLANTVLVLLTKNTKKTSDRGLVLLGTAINM